MPIFVQPWYLDAVCQAGNEGWEAVIAEKGGQVAAVLPYYWRKKGPFQIQTVPHLTKFMGIYFHQDFSSTRHQHQLSKTVIEQLPKAAYFGQNFHYHYTDWLPFYWTGYQQSTQYSYVLDDLRDLDQVLANFSADYRNHKLRKAKAAVRVVNDRSLKEFYDVETMSFQRQGLPFPFSYDYLAQYDQVMKDRGVRQIFFAVDQEEQIHSVLYLLIDHDRTYYHMAGDHPELRQSGAAILLVWEAIQYTKKVLQKNIFDFEGSMIPSIERVRRQFGAKQVPYFKIEKYHSPFISLAKKMIPLLLYRLQNGLEKNKGFGKK